MGGILKIMVIDANLSDGCSFFLFVTVTSTSAIQYPAKIHQHFSSLYVALYILTRLKAKNETFSLIKTFSGRKYQHQRFVYVFDCDS